MADAEDALQEALAAIWRRWHRFETHPNPEALVLRMAINAAYDALRRRHRRLRWFTTDQPPIAAPDPAPSAFDTVAGAQAHARVRAALASLSRNQATAIIMHAVADVPYDAVAAAMHCREVTVRTHVARARAKLRIVLSDLVPLERDEEKTHG